MPCRSRSAVANGRKFASISIRRCCRLCKADICDMSPVSAGSMDALWSSPQYRNASLPARCAPRTLGEFPPGAERRRPTEHVAARHAARGAVCRRGHAGRNTAVCFSRRADGAIDMMYGFRLEHGGGATCFMAHKTAFTTARWRPKLLEAGFSDVVIIRQHFNLEATARKLATLSQPRNQYKWADKGDPGVCAASDVGLVASCQLLVAGIELLEEPATGNLIFMVININPNRINSSGWQSRRSRPPAGERNCCRRGSHPRPCQLRPGSGITAHLDCRRGGSPAPRRFLGPRHDSEFVGLNDLLLARPPSP